MKKEIVIITGASSGIGNKTAYLLAEKGYHVVLLARSEEQLKIIKESILKNSRCAFKRGRME